MPLGKLINRPDNFEVIRDEIAAILALETVNQQALAVAVPLDPKPWKFDVYKERSRIWDSLDQSEEPVTPVVNVWFDSEDVAGNQSYNALTQTMNPGIFNIDVFTSAINTKNVGLGYLSADQQAVFDCQRIMRLIRTILFSVPPDRTQPGDDYSFLNLRGVVGYRRIQSVSMFQPDYKKQTVIIAAGRIALAVKYIETGIEGPDNDFDLLQLQTTIGEGGQVNYEFDLTTP